MSLPILGSSISSHLPSASAASHASKRPPPHSRRRALLPSSIKSLIGKPAAAFERLVGDLQIGYNQDAAERRRIEERKAIVNLSLQGAPTLAEWKIAATELDELDGNNDWKHESESPEYNHTLIQERLDQLEQARQSRDATRMLFLIRTALSRNLGGMDNVKLYSHTHIGTKKLVERYIDSALDTLSVLLDVTQYQYNSEIGSRLVLENVLAARQAFGRSALLFSGGGTFGMSHIGVAKCLWEQRLLPRIMSGASAGSIVCAVLCVKTDDEIPATLQDFCFGDLEVFTKTGGDDGLLSQLARFLKVGALFDIANLTGVMRNLLGDMTFQEAYNRTRRILNITVSSASVFELPRLLNYVTAPNVLIWSAVAASCSVPFIFSPAGLLAKDPKTGLAHPWNPSPQQWIDGSVDNDLPMTRLAEMFNVNHFIVSQVNPHVVPFLAQEEQENSVTSKHSALGSGPEWLSFMANMAKDEAMHRMNVLCELGIFPNIFSKTRSILSQKYSGDITILPEVSYSQFPKVLQNPTTEFMVQASLHGERATWPKLGRIQNHCAIELALDDAIQHLRARIAFSPSQVDLRLGTIAPPRSRAGSDGGRRKDRRADRKHLRFSGEVDSFDGFKPNSSRPISTYEPKSNPASSAKLTSLAPTLKKQPSRSASSFQLTIQKPKSPPIFTTASEDDCDSYASDFSSTSTTEPHSPLTKRGIPPDYFSPAHGQSSELWPSAKQLFLHASQPSTPYLSSTKRSYFGTRPPTPIATSAAAAISQLAMTPALVEQASILQGQTPDHDRSSGLSRQTTPTLSRSSSRRTSVAGSIANSRSSLELDASGTRGMLRRKKSTLSKGLKSLTRLSRS